MDDNSQSRRRADTRLADNESKACEAVIRILERRASKKREALRRPEIDLKGPPVEYRFDLGKQHFAVEHTLVEAFPGQLKTSVEFDEFAGPIQDKLYREMPKPGTYQLSFPIDAPCGLKRKDFSIAREEIIEWVRSAGERLHAAHPDRRDRHHSPRGFQGEQKHEIRGIPIKLFRQVHWSETGIHDGMLTVSRFAPPEIEDKRLHRIETALNKKCPKLAACKAEGARSILVLEDRDISLSNHSVIGDAVEKLIRERGDIPDEIFLVDASIGKQWTIWSIFRDGASWPDEELAARYTEVDPKDLIEP